MNSRESCLPDLFKVQAGKTPDVLAVVSGHERTSYADLDRATDALVAYLRHHGVSLEDRVGIFMRPARNTSSQASEL